MPATYTAANVALGVIPDMQDFFRDMDARIRGYDPPPIRPRVDPDVDTSAAEDDLGPGGPAGEGMVAAAAATGIAVGAVLVAGIGEAIEQERLQDKLAAQLGGSNPQWAADMGAIAGRLYANAYGDSLEEVQDALRSVLQSGILPEDASDAEIQNITASVLDLSTAFGEDASKAAEGLSAMLRNNLAPDAQSALDVITRGFQQGVNLREDYLDTLSEYSGQFRKLGIDGATATGLLSQGLRGGARDADFVADALKEFSIRAIDGSKASSDAYAVLGIDAAAMSAQIAQGGEGASAGLQLVLDRLRAMEDPVAREAAAVGLFGTKAEDLGAALFALDPSTATAALGDVEGAAAELGQTLNDNTATNFEALRRTVQQGVVDFLGGTVIPILSELAGWGVAAFSWGPVPDILGFLVTAGGTIALVLGGIAAATWVWTAAQGAFNAVMAMNPYVLIAAAVIGLVAGLVWAYNNVAWFRDGVDAALRWVGDTATWLWQSVFVPAWDAIAGSVSWAWTTVIQPVLSFLWDLLRIVGAVIFTVLVAPFVIAWNIVAGIVSWAWTTVISPVLGAIGALFGWLWTNAVQPTLTAIGGLFSWLWASVIMPLVDLYVGYLRFLGDIFMWLWTNAVQPAMRGIGEVATWVWSNVLQPAFDGIMTGVRAVGDAFAWAVGIIGDVWGRIEGIVRPPVQFVVDVVYNAGIRPAWNFIAGLFDLGLLPEMRFARGGLVPGYAPGRDTVPALLSPGEGVLVPEAVRMLGADTVLAINAAARRGRRRNGAPVDGDIGYLGDRPGVQRFADGGIVGWLWDTVGSIGSFVGGVVDFLSDPAAAVRKVFEGLDTGGLGGVGQLSEALFRFPIKVVDGAIDWVSSFVRDTIGDGADGAARGLAWARTQHGKPYQWGGAGNPSWDCSGFMAGITRVIRGESPGRIGTTATMPWSGFARGLFGPFQIGNSKNTGSGIGHMAGTLLGVNVESAGGGKGVRVGPSARGATDGLFGERYSLTFDQGGWLPPGMSLVRNGTGRPEPILTDAQWQLMREHSTASGGGDTVVQARYPFSPAELDRLADTIERRRRWNARRAG